MEIDSVDQSMCFVAVTTPCLLRQVRGLISLVAWRCAEVCVQSFMHVQAGYWVCINMHGVAWGVF
jgi:hypothetical protein